MRSLVASGIRREPQRHTVRDRLGAIEPEAADQLTEYLAAGQAVLGTMQAQETIVLERFFDEPSGGRW